MNPISKIFERFPKEIFFSEGAKTVIKNFFSLMLWQVAITVLPQLITIPYLVRVIGPEKFGLIALAQSLIRHFSVFIDYGFNLSATRQISIHREDVSKVSLIMNTVIAIKVLFSLLGLLLTVWILIGIPKFGQNWLLYLISFGALYGNVFFPIFFFQGIEKMKYIFYCNLISIFFLLLLFVCVKSPQDFLWVALIQMVGSVLAGLVALGVAYRRFKLHFCLPRWEQIKFQLKEGWHVFISNAAISSFWDTRLFILGLLATNEETGYFAIAQKLTMFALFFPQAILLAAAFPRLTKLYNSDPERGHKLIKRFQRITTLSYVAIVPSLFIFASPLTKFICGYPYPEVIVNFRILLGGVFLFAANVFRVHRFLIAGQGSIYARIFTFCGIGGVFLTFVLAYFFSSRGASASFVLAGALAILLTLREEKKNA